MRRSIVQLNGDSPAKGRGAGNPGHIKASLDDFLTAEAEYFRPHVEKSWVTGVDYAGLFRDSQVLVFGDTDHSQHAMLGGLESEMPGMKKAGVTDVALEMSDGPKYMKALEAFYATGDVSHIRWIGEQTRTPIRITRLLSSAYDEGVRVHFVDLSGEHYDPRFNDKQIVKQRGVHMGERIAGIAKQSGRRVVVFTGYAHLEYEQIPKQLDEQGVPHKKVGLVCAGQPTPPFSAYSLGAMGASEAVRDKGLQDKVGTVHLGGAYGLDAFIHFPRVQLIDPDRKEMTGTPLLNASNGAPSEGAIVPLQSGADLPALVFDMRTLVEPSVYKWKETNTRKIFQFVDGMNELSSGQKLYLGIMLENYVRSTRHHGGGSICKMEYDPEARAFGIDTVDTFGYPMRPDADYGSLERHREVTLANLSNQFGFSELAVSKLEDIPETNVRLNPDKPELAYKLLLLASTYATHPERIKSDGWSSVFVSNKYGAHIVTLEVDDFKLSDLEARLLRISDQIKSDSFHLSTDFYRATATAQMEAPRFRFGHKQLLRKIGMSLMNLSSPAGTSYFGTGVTKRILEARGKLEYLGNESALEYITKTEEELRGAVRALEEIDSLSSKDDRLYDRRFELAWNDSPFTFKDAVKRGRDLWNSYLGELYEIRERILTERTTFPIMVKNINH